MKNIAYILIVFQVFWFIPVFWDESCPYTGMFEECVEANKSWSARSIEDFVCPETQNTAEMMYQIVLDQEFKKIDKEVYNQCKNLEKSKDYFFWENQQESFLKGVDFIESKFSPFGEYWGKYNELCNGSNEKGILMITTKCLWGSTPLSETKDFFLQSTCIGLAESKLAMSREIAYNTMKVNKMQVRKDEKKKFFQSRRWKYGDLIDMMLQNIGYMERIWKKWNVKIKRNVY